MNKKSPKQRTLGNYLLLAAILVFLSSSFFSLGFSLLTRDTEPFVTATEHTAHYFSKLQRFVHDQDIQLDSLDELRRFTRRHPNHQLIIYDQQLSIYDSRQSHSQEDISKSLPPKTLPHYDLYIHGKSYPTYIYFNQHSYFALWQMTIFFTTFLIGSIVMVYYAYRRHHHWEREVATIVHQWLQEDFKEAIPPHPFGLFASLIHSLSHMRTIMVQHRQYILKVKAESDFLAAKLSHDIRTPIGVINSYLELAKKELDSPYILKAYERNRELNRLISQLFDYFLLTIKTPADSEMETYDNMLEIHALLDEYMALLRHHGFMVEDRSSPDYYPVRCNISMLMRVFDNLLSNNLKYTDSKSPVNVLTYMEEANHMLTITSRTLPHSKTTSGLGLTICQEILSLHGGAFHYSQGEQFTITIAIPIYHEEKN